MANFAIRVSGRDYSGWKSLAITRTIDAIASSFTMSAHDSYALAGQVGYRIKEGDDCELLVNGSVLVTGFVERREVSFDANSLEVTISGAGKPAKLVKNSIETSAWEFRGPDILTVINKFSAAYGVKVSLAPGVVAPDLKDKFSITPGDKIFDLIDRAGKYFGMLPVEMPDGNVQFIIPGTKRVTTILKEGDNIKRGSSSFSNAERYGKVRVSGQYPGSSTSYSGEAVDSDGGVSGFIFIQADSAVDKAMATAMAEWERTVRAARGDTATIDLQGWEHSGGLWEPGYTVKVDSPTLGFQGDVVIKDVMLSLDGSGGESSSLILTRPDAYSRQPKPVGGWKL